MLRKVGDILAAAAALALAASGTGAYRAAAKATPPAPAEPARLPLSPLAELRREVARTPVHGVWAKGGPVFARLSEETVHGVEGLALASFGDAATLGAWAFGTACWSTGLFQSGVLPVGEMSFAFPNLLVYGGLVLFIAGLFLYPRNNGFLATTCCSFGAVNFTRGALLLAVNRGLLPHGGTAHVLEGALMEAYAYIALSLAVAAVKENVPILLMLACTFIGFVLGGLPLIGGQAGALAHAGRIGGHFLFAAALFAYYTGTALIVNTAFRRPVLPIGGQA